MGPDLDLKGKSRTNMDISPGEDGTASKEIEKMTCAKNCEDNSFLTEALPTEHTPVQGEGPEINVTDLMESSEKEESASDSEDATENSSSFCDTDSEIGNGPNDVEVESQSYDNGLSSLAFDTFDDLFRARKKKLTFHWREFIRPLMWRCKWAELQIKELRAKELKYERQLAEYDQRQQRDLLNFPSEDRSVKSTPITCQNRKVKIMKRNKRKRVEDETDIASYMSQHSLFSTLVNKKSSADRPHMDVDFGNIVKPSKSSYTNNEFDIIRGWPCLEFKDDNTLEEIMQKVDEYQLQLRELKVRMDKVIGENEKTIYSNIEASTPRPMPHENGNVPAASLCTTSHNKEDVIMPGSEGSSLGEITPFPDMVESSDKTLVGVSSVKIKDEVLIKEETGVQPIGEPIARRVAEEENDVHPASGAEAVSVQGKNAGKSKLGTPKNKRKRGKRKGRFTKYRRISG